MSSVRQPPRTYSYTTGGGVCRWCEEPILRAGVQLKRTRWHTGCLKVWMIATSSAAAREACLERDRGVCKSCGFECEAPSNMKAVKTRAGVDFDLSFDRHGIDATRTPYNRIKFVPRRPWIADHIVPLWSVDRTDPEAFRYWQLDNLQTLCQVCSDAKTAEEAGMRAKELRIRNKVAGVETRKYRRKIPSRPFSSEHRPLRSNR